VVPLRSSPAGRSGDRPGGFPGAWGVVVAGTIRRSAVLVVPVSAGSLSRRKAVAVVPIYSRARGGVDRAERRAMARGGKKKKYRKQGRGASTLARSVPCDRDGARSRFFKVTGPRSLKHPLRLRLFGWKVEACLRSTVLAFEFEWCAMAFLLGIPSGLQIGVGTFHGRDLPMREVMLRCWPSLVAR